MKLLRNENGSSLLMIIITIGVLTVLGTAVLSMSIVNVNMKYTDRDVKKALYYSESGIDQVAAMIGEYVDEAISDANEKAIADVNRTYKLTQEIVEYLNVYYPEHYLDSLSNIQGEVSRYNSKTSLNVDAAEFIDKKLYLNSKFLEEITSTNYAELVSSSYPELKMYFEDNTITGKSLNALGYLYYDNSGINNYEPYTESNKYTAFIKYVSSEPYNFSIMIDSDDLSDYSKGRLDYYFVNYMNGKTSVISNAIDSFKVTISGETKNSEYDFPGTEATIDNSDIKMDVASITAFNVNNKDSNMVINGLECEFTYKDHTRKTIKTDIVIKRLSENINVVMEQRLKEVSDNPIWQYPVITMEDLNLNGNTNINGNVYAYGTSSDNKENYGGITINSGTSSIEGDIITHAYLQAKGSGNINITGSVYADSVVIQEGASNPKITINKGNVYTCDDLELNDIGNISIEGSYFGYSNTSIKPNGASSIVLNKPNVATIVDIDGSSVANYTPYVYKDSLGSEYKGIFIGGTAWIEDEFTPIPQGTNNSYQTGESVGIRGNYLAYAFPVTLNTPITRNGVNYSVLSEDGDDLTVGSKSGLSLYYKIHGTNIKYSVNDKIEYFKQMDQTNPGIINKGNGSINIAESTYNNGAINGIGFTNNNDIYTSLGSSKNKLEELANIISRDHLFLLSFLKHFGKRTDAYPGLFGNANDENASEIVEKIQKLESDLYAFNKYNPLSVYTNVYNEGTINTVLLKNIVDNPGVDVEISNGTIVNCTEITRLSNSDITINTPGNYSGIIFTTKNVTLGTGVNFYGTIISGESLNLNGTATITNNTKEIKKYLALLIANNADLQAIFNVSNTLGYELPILQYFQSSSIITGNETRMNYANLIKFEHWRVDE